MGEASMPERLRDVLGPVGRRLGLGQAVETGRLWAGWSEVVGAQIAAHVKPTSLRDGVLRVRADSPAWATEAGYLGPEIARRANAVAGRHLVREVRVWTGPASPEEPVLAERTGPPTGRVESSTTAREHGAREDPHEALEAARRAWFRRRSRGSR